MLILREVFLSRILTALYLELTYCNTFNWINEERKYSLIKLDTSLSLTFNDLVLYFKGSTMTCVAVEVTQTVYDRN